MYFIQVISFIFDFLLNIELLGIGLGLSHLRGRSQYFLCPFYTSKSGANSTHHPETTIQRWPLAWQILSSTGFVCQIVSSQWIVSRLGSFEIQRLGCFKGRGNDEKIKNKNTNSDAKKFGECMLICEIG